MSVVTDLYGNRLRAPNRVPFVTPVGQLGQLSSIVLDLDDADAEAVDTERWLSSTGAMAFRVIPKAPAAALANFLGILFAWSTTANALTAVNALMAALDTGISTPSAGGTEVANCGVLLPLVQAGGVTGFVGNTEWITWDGETRIKTIAARSVGANWVAGAVLQVVT
jgi:hypothetical protein